MKIILLCFSLIINTIIPSLKQNNQNTIYSEYSKYNSIDYERLEKLRTLNNYKPLETINIYYTQNFCEPTFPNYFLTLTNKYFKYDLIPPNLVNIDNYKATYPSILKSTKDNISLDKTTLHAYINMIEELSIKYPVLKNLYIYSGYRDKPYQKILYERALDKSYVAYPGYSEHHTGLAIDISNLNYGLTKRFEESLEFKILSNECYKYGFILRYPKNKEHITGYSYEPWHFRYVGIQNSIYITKHNLTLDEYILQNFEL